MKAANSEYTVSESKDRIKEILDASDGAFEEVKTIPPSDSLTYGNGFYVDCTSVFIDIRGSSQLPDLHTRPVLAKIYRAYISECVAVLNGDEKCREVAINGDCVHGIFDTPYRADIDSAFCTAARLNSLVNVLNWLFEKKGYATIRCGVGLAYGRALMLKAGFKGSGINDVVWMGDVVNEASNLCHQGNKGVRAAVQVSIAAHENLQDEYKKLLCPVCDALFAPPTHYEGDVVNQHMEDWLQEQKSNARSSDDLLWSLFNGQGLFGQAPPVKQPSEWNLADILRGPRR